MTYIIKNTSGLINTRVTDTGRQKLSQGNFNIKYFQIGDSEISYNKLPDTYNYPNSYVLEPPFNTQNTTGIPQSTKHSVKYPYFVDNTSGNTYGIPYMDSVVDSVYNRAPLRGFFTGNTTASTISWSALTGNRYVITANYVVDMSTLNGSNTIDVIYSGCNYLNIQTPSVGDFITIFYDGKSSYNCECINLPTPTPSPTPTIDSCNILTELAENLMTENDDNLVYCDTSVLVQNTNNNNNNQLLSEPTTTPTPTPSSTNGNPCLSPTPTPTPTKTPCITPSSKPICPPPPEVNCFVSLNSCYPILTYKIIAVCGNKLTLDRPTPNFLGLSPNCIARTIIYPPNMTTIYDSVTPRPHWSTDAINFETVCDIDQFDVKIWNMNIPWTENPAGLNYNIFEDYTKFGSIDYIGTKEYLGYNSSLGQSDTSKVYFYNSFDEIVEVKPEEQKTIAIVHYTNQTIDLFYGEKFALEPYDSTNPQDTTGQARNFKLHIPWLMWHKNTECCFGQTFWVDPPGFDGKDLFKVQYIKSRKNSDMNQPGIRYYHLWDTNPNSDGLPSRVGKVFPDNKMVVIDDEELVAAMSYKSNRNWTLPAPQLSLITPNTCDITTSSIGLISGNSETLYVTYRLSNSYDFTNSLHCNYYTKITEGNLCSPENSKNAAIRFGGEFQCLKQPGYIPTTTTTTTTTICPSTCDIPNGYYADKFEIICQLVPTGQRPDSSLWKIIDYTSAISNQFINGFVTQESLTGTTFIITPELYGAAPYYNLNDYVELVPNGTTGLNLNFGDEYYFYGSLETDIQATIYEMRYKINLSDTEFQNTSNPTWTPGTNSYVTEIALLDENKDILVMSKLQSPTLRTGIQQYLVKIDF
jgi:hypothetical protein